MRGLLVACGVVALLTAEARAQAQSDGSPAALAARKRQEAVHSVEFKYTIDEVIEPGAYTGMVPGNESNSFPAERRTVKSQNRLVISGDRIRIERNHPNFSTITNDLSKNTELTVSDGKTMKEFYGPPANADRENSYGIIAFPDRAVFATDVILAPMLLACRGYSGPLGPLKFSKSLTGPGERVKVRGAWCAEYTFPGRVRCWVEDTADQPIRRIQTGGRGPVEVQSEVDSRTDPGSGQVLPSSWKQSHYTATGKLRKTLTVSVTEVVVNGQYADSEFDLSFPPGIEIEDQRSNQAHLVRDDGTLRTLSRPGEDSVGVREDVKSNWLGRNLLWIVVVFAAGLTVLGGVFGRRLFRRAPNTPPSLH